MSAEQEDLSSEIEASKPLRPALITSRYTISEYSIFLHHLFVGLADESVQSVLVCPPGCDVNSIVYPSVEVVRHPVFELPLLRHQSEKILIEKLEKFKPTVIHCLCESEASLTGRLASQLGLPYVITVNALQKHHKGLFVSPEYCARIIVPTKSIAANLAEVYPEFAERIEQINMGTFTEERTSCFSEPDRLASMLSAHALEDEREFKNLLNAVRHLAVEGHEFMLVIMGEGRAERRLRKLLDSLGLSRVVTIVPMLEPKRCVLAAGDIFIRPIADDAFDPLLLEAMSVGAAVAGCKGGVDDLIIEGKTAVVFDADDELSIYGRLQQLLDRRELAWQLARNAQEYLRENHTVSTMISAILRIYREVQNSRDRVRECF